MSDIDLDATAIPGRETFPPAEPAADERAVPFGLPLGARMINDGRCEFRVWAPSRESVDVHIVAPDDRRVPLRKMKDGYHEATVDSVSEGARYFFVIDGNERPDPASRFQPDGVHAASAVMGRDFEWHDDGWRGLELEDHVIYELHVGTFTPEGTFEAVIPYLDRLKELGVTAVELLPIAQFPGERNWGYDGTFMGAAQASYGGPRALKRLVDACHQRGLAILLDVVFNHLGPEGNYLGEYGPYFTDRYKTPWGLALNFDGPHSDHVRWFFVHAALQWVDEFHFDGLRVDAVHAIIDHSAEPFLQDLTNAVRERAELLGRNIYTIAESDLNDPRVITSSEQLGLGFDSQWCDDFHHSLHTLLTGERDGYYEGFGKTSDLARVLTTGYLYTGQHSTYRARKYGTKPNTTDGAKFVVFAQNHDQTGNRMLGDRLSNLVSHDQLRLAAAAVVLAPFVPMLFMGEEYGEKAPFQYFTSHSDEALIEAVRKGRAEEFDDFAWQGEPPDPHATDTFHRSKLNWTLLEHDEHQSLFRLYQRLFRLRRETPALRSLNLQMVETFADDERRVLLIRRGGGDVLVAFNFADKAQTVDLPWEFAGKALLDTGAKLDGGRITLPPHAFALYGRE
ncbi:MAG: maltooligosyltrehalose trehalohydrolase [Acidobacteriota bacterium]|nr:maltooligosyltrehalose trehalohydrolase [Acidobacteriota bacterium]